MARLPRVRAANPGAAWRTGGRALLAGSLLACSSGELGTLPLRFSFANEATAGRADHVTVSIVRGESCDGSDVVYEAEVTRDGSVSAPPSLGAGTYSFVGEASSADCTFIAYGCVTVRLPSDSPPQVRLADVPERPSCTGSCASTCEPDAPDGGGALDAGADGSPGDGDGDGGLDDGGTTAEDAGSDGGEDGGPPPACDDGVLRARHCYRFVTTTRTWQDAENDCVAWGGHLVSLQDGQEELWLFETQVAAGFGDTERFWLGFSDRAVETVWEWSDGSSSGLDPSIVVYEASDPAALRFKVPFTEQHTHWGPNLPAVGNDEPNNGSGSNPTAEPGEDCAESNGARLNSPGGVSPRPAWDDQDCEKLKPYVCER